MSRENSEQDWLSALQWIRERKIKPSRPDARLPSEGALAKESHFTKAVVRRALQQLVANQEITSKKGSGYYTLYDLNKVITIERSLEPHSANVDDTEVGPLEKIPASADVSTYLKIHVGEQVIHFKTKRYILHGDNRRPCLFSNHYIRNDKVDLNKFAAYLSKKKSVSSAVRDQRVSAYLRSYTDVVGRFPDAIEREELILGPFDIVIETWGVNVDNNNDPIELTVSCWPSHIWDMRFQF